MKHKNFYTTICFVQAAASAIRCAERIGSGNVPSALISAALCGAMVAMGAMMIKEGK